MWSHLSYYSPIVSLLVQVKIWNFSTKNKTECTWKRIFTFLLKIDVKLTILRFPHDTSIGQDLKPCPGHSGDFLIDRLGVWCVGPQVSQTAQFVKKMYQTWPHEALLLCPKSQNKLIVYLHSLKSSEVFRNWESLHNVNSFSLTTHLIVWMEK